MGVHGLWELLAPVGHRVSNERVRNKVLAVDVSIWLTQFVKAMRDAEGAQVRNGHLLGVFRRCIKLLYLSVKPVFVFDGATPPLKRKTLSSRRAQREKHAAKLRRLAEKMLLNRIKQSSVGHAIAKKRKSKPQKASARLKKDAPSSPIDTEHQESEIVDLNHQQGAFPDAVLPSSQESQENPKKAMVKSSRGFDDLMFSDGSLGAAETHDTEIRLPENVDDLDDEVLLKLPSKLQSEVFKQAKLTHRARHRENMLQGQQRPAQFSMMQIEGFLRHTALNRKISRVRNVLNAKSGASRRIASDSRRGFVLTEDVSMDTHADTAGRQSKDESKEAKSPKAKSEHGFQPDLLADIRARKDTFKYGTPNFSRKKSSLDMHQNLESGNEWASKVLQGKGSLSIPSTIPGVTSIEYGHQPGFHTTEIFSQSGEEQRYPEISFMQQKNDANLEQKAYITDEDSSDEEEWEDGNQPTSHGFSEELGGKHKKEKLESETRSSRSGSDEYQEPDVIDSTYGHRGSNDTGSSGLMKKLITTREADQLTGSRRDSKPSTSHHNVPRAAHGSTVMPHSPIVNRINEDHLAGNLPPASVYRGYTSLPQNPNPQKSVQDHVQISRMNERDGDDTLRLFSDGRGFENQGKPLIRRTAEFQKPNSLRVHHELIEMRGFDKRGGTSTSANTNNPTPPFGESDSFSTDKLRPTAKEHRSPYEPKERDDLRTETEDCKRLLQSKRVLPKREVRGTESKTPKESSEEKSERVVEDKHSNEGFCTTESGEPGSPDGPTRNPASSCGVPSAKRCLDDVYKERSHDANQQSEEQEPSVAQLESMQRELEAEAVEIDRQRSTYRGGADTVADEMYSETRDLIKLLGIPYLEAPMEAEAQCAFLNRKKVVHGVLTEDSDAFLFGAVTVYRHLFAEGRFAEAYEANDIRQCLGLDQEKLITLAYLLGSDYTSGVRGVGIVNSMEILEAFPGPTGLTEFRDWMKSVTLLDEEPGEDSLSCQSTDAVRRRFCWKHRNMKRNWEIREGFPNAAVFNAYKEPVIHESTEKFSWGSIDYEGLARFCWDKFGWDNVKFEGAVGPLRQKLQETGGSSHQRRIDDFFRPHRFAKIRSERLQKAVQGIAGDLSSELMSTETDRKKRAKLKNTEHQSPRLFE